MAAPMNHEFDRFDIDKINFLREQSSKLESFEEVKEIEYREFFIEYLLPNKPCIFTPDVTISWKSRQDWVMENHTPNFGFLTNRFGDAVVPVANCKQEQYSSHPKQDMRLSEYLDYWDKYRARGYQEDEPCLYLKDWHFTKAYPDYKAYTTPVYFQSDWLNEFWDTLPEDDYRFVYMGPKGTWTPFHADVYRSFSWSANICGKKKWVFFPPGCEEMLKDNLGNLVYDVMSSDLEDQEKFPNAHKVKGQMLEVIQGEGQIIFVPSGWHHQVYNLEDTISINHNWLNGCNIDICWRHLQDGLRDVRKEIEHCRDMDGWDTQCQLILKACAGIDYLQFIKMLRVIAENRIEQYKQGQGSCDVCTRLCKDSPGRKDSPGTGNESHVAVAKDCKVDISLTDLNIDCKSDSDQKLDIEEDVVGTEQKCDTKTDVTTGTKNNQDNSLMKEYTNKKCNIEKHEFEKESKDHQTETRTKEKSCGQKEVSLTNKRLEQLMKSACLSNTEWSENDYLIFDLFRIRQTLQDIISDDGYRNLDKQCDESAEYVLEIIETF